VPISAQLGTQQLPDSQHTVQVSTSGVSSNESPAAQEADAIAKLAQFFGLKDKPLGPTMEDQVIQALAIKYNVNLVNPGSTGVKTTKTTAAAGGSPGRAGGVTPRAQTETSTQPTSTNASRVPNKKALAEIAVKMGIDDPGENPLIAIAGLQTSSGSTGNPLTQIQGDTNAQMYANFIKQGFNPKTGALTPLGQKWETALVQAGYLDLNSNLGTPTANQIQNAYLSLLNVATNGQQTGDPHTTVAPGGGIVAAISAGQSIAKQTTANAPPSEAYATVQGVASEFGVYLSPLQINDIANKFAGQITAEGSPGDVENSIKDLVIQQYNPNNPNDPAGVANSMFIGIQQAAQNYQIPMGSTQIQQMVQEGLQTASVAYPASATTDVVNKATQWLQQQAEGLYPSLSTQIKAGSTVTSLTAPYLSIASEITGVPQSSMLTANAGAGGGSLGAGQSKWAAFLQGGNSTTGGNAPNPSGSTQNAASGSSEPGAPQMMTMDQWKQKLMTDPQYGFQNTQGGKNAASQLASAILNEFGKVNTDGGSSQPFNNIGSPTSTVNAGGSGS
jgi:hypothetical protein